MSSSSRDQRDIQDVLRRMYALPHRSQMQVFATLLEYFEAGVGVESKLSKELRNRQVALAAMQRAASHLELPDGVAPGGPDYDRAAEELGLPPRGEIIRAYQRWKNAQNALTGGRVPESPAQRSLRRATSGRTRVHETYLNGLRKWLDTPGLASETKADCAAFVDAHNDALGPGEEPLVKPETVLAAFPGLRWEEMVAAARGELDPYALMRERGLRDAEEARLSIGFIGAGTVAALLGIRVFEPPMLARIGKLPVPVAVIGGARAWWAADILAHDRDEPVPERTEGEMQRVVVDSAELSGILGHSTDYIRTALHQHRKTVPLPDGRVSGRHYWLRSNVERWLAERPTGPGRVSG